MSSYRRDLPHGLMFHRFRSPGEPPQQGALTMEEFERILLYVGRERILTPFEWIDRLSAGALEPHHICITFDDGLRSQSTHALPVLDRHKLKAFWFVYSCVFEGRPVMSEVYSHAAARLGGMDAFIARFLKRAPQEMLVLLDSPAFADYAARTRGVAPFYSDDDLRYRFLRNRSESRPEFDAVIEELLREHGISPDALASQLWITDAQLRSLAQQGHAIGLHSYDHPYALAELPRQQQRDQYRRNFEHISTATGQPPRSMSHPLNSYNDHSLAILWELGIQCGFRANMQPCAAGINPTPLEFAREDSALLLRAASA